MSPTQPPTGPPTLSRATLDRAAVHRLDEAWVTAQQQSAAARVLLLREGRTAVRHGPDGLSLATVLPTAAPHGTRRLLAADSDASWWSVEVGEESELADGDEVGDLRTVGAALTDTDAGLLTTAVGLHHWHRVTTFCPRCGARLLERQAGWLLACPTDGSHHFPRTDPAVIMLIHDGGDRVLLGRQPIWPADRWSTLAGFVEPGESAEMAVVRETREESGVEVTDVTYVASQPWPFPASLMLGFTARATTEQIETGDDELEDARWFSRDELLDGRTVDGQRVIMPPPVSVAHRLITGWLDEPLRYTPRWG